MMIRKPMETDISQLQDFLELVISDTSKKEEIEEDDFISEEVESKIKVLKNYLQEPDKDSRFLIALDGEKIIGTISSSFCRDKILELVGNKVEKEFQIGIVYIHPDYQKKGVATNLLNEMYEILKNRGIKEFYLDSGYLEAQKYWKKKLGAPLIVEKDCWGEGIHHMIWKSSLN